MVFQSFIISYSALFNSVINISVLNHTVSFVPSYDDVIQNQDIHAIQQSLKLNC